MGLYRTLQIFGKPEESHVVRLLISGPSFHNALVPDFYAELSSALSFLDQDPDVAVVILAGNGSHFCTGIDFKSIGSALSSSTLEEKEDPSRLSERIRREITLAQASISAIERCRKPVIAAIHGACIGAGVDIAAACDIRFCSDDAFFSVKEVDLAITADFGTLQRLPRIVGYGNAMELALTARRFSASEAKSLGLVSGVFASREAMEEGVRHVAEGIAAKSPLAVAGTKAVMVKSRDMSVEQGLDYVAAWNSAMLLSLDLKEALSAHIHKRMPVFSKL